MATKYANNATTTLASGITAVATSITVKTGDGVRFPTLTASDYFYATLISDSNLLEIVKVTARSGDVMTVVRAQDGTTALEFSANDRFEMRVAAVLLGEFIQRYGDTMTGNLGIKTSPSSSWAAAYSVVQVNTTGSVNGNGATIVMANNYYYDGTNFKYLTSAPATDYFQYDGTHIWRSASSGTAGNNATMVNTMTLDASGNLAATGTVSASGGNSTNWNTAYGWGNHASAGYITGSGNAATATNISNTGTVTLASATESNSITISQPTYTTDTPVKLLNFDWYGNVMSMGAIRSGNTASNGLGVYYTASGGSRIEVARFGITGNFTAVGNVTAYSDERLKKDWAPVQDGFVSQLAEVKSGTYTRIESDLRQAGVSAQSLQEVLPEVVLEDIEGHLSVAYGNAALVAAVELAKEVVQLRARLDVLEGK